MQQIILESRIGCSLGAKSHSLDDGQVGELRAGQPILDSRQPLSGRRPWRLPWDGKGGLLQLGSLAGCSIDKRNLILQNLVWPFIRSVRGIYKFIQIIVVVIVVPQLLSLRRICCCRRSLLLVLPCLSKLNCLLCLPSEAHVQRRTQTQPHEDIQIAAGDSQNV